MRSHVLEPANGDVTRLSIHHDDDRRHYDEHYRPIVTRQAGQGLVLCLVLTLSLLLSCIAGRITRGIGVERHLCMLAK